MTDFRYLTWENMTDMLRTGDIPVKTSHLRLGREDTSHLRWSQNLQLFTNFAKLKLHSRNFIKTLQRQVCYVVMLSTYQERTLGAKRTFYHQLNSSIHYQLWNIFIHAYVVRWPVLRGYFAIVLNCKTDPVLNFIVHRLFVIL